MNLKELWWKLKIYSGFGLLEDQPQIMRLRKRLQYIGLRLEVYESTYTVQIEQLEFSNSLGGFKQSKGNWNRYQANFKKLDKIVDELYTLKLILELAVHLPYYKAINPYSVWNPRTGNVVIYYPYSKAFQIEIKVDFDNPNVIQSTLKEVETQMYKSIPHIESIYENNN